MNTAAHLHCSFAAGCRLFKQVQNVEATFLGPPDSSAWDADGQCQEALGHVQEGLAKLLNLFVALKVGPSKD